MATETNPVPTPTPKDLVEVKKPTSLLIAQFFLFPLIIIAICVGIFLLFGYLTYNPGTAREYLNEIKTGSGTARWQAAFELSNMLSNDDKKLRDPELIQGVRSLYAESKDDDPRVRRYLAMTLGKMKDRDAVPVLLKGLDEAEQLKNAPAPEGMFGLGPSPEEHRQAQIQTQIYTLWALGTIGDNAAVSRVLKELKNEDPDVRKFAAYVLGVLNDSSAIHDLQVALNDAHDDVRWNAANALARLGDAAGVELLMTLIDHSFVDQLKITPEAKSELMSSAVMCLGLLKWEAAREKMKTLSQMDPDLAVRNASIEALKKF